MNVITITGNLGKNAETKYTASGKPITEFSIASTSGYGDNQKTTWLTCKCFGERFEKIAQYLTKGSKTGVTGTFTMDEWEYEGKQYSKPVVLVNDVDLPPRNQQGQSQTPKQQATGSQQAQNMQSQAPDFAYEYSDDIPFSPIGLQYPQILGCM